MILKETSYINDAIIDKQSSINWILWYLTYIFGLCYSVAILWESMWCGWKLRDGSIDFDSFCNIKSAKLHSLIYKR